MRLNKIKLNNIRSYNEVELNFPDGSLLLNGNIGSGKSTILQAIDFALFGLRNYDLTGDTLLRHGQDNGSVVLEFNVDNKIIEVCRTLKRISNRVNQDSGYLMVNGNREELTPTEIKSKILTLFNYPQELLTKSKALIFRYTIYTPQEEMKAILLGDEETRLDILRKVFAIDKYKRIIENVKTFSFFLNQNIKTYLIKSEGIEELLKEIELRKKELEELSNSSKEYFLKKKDVELEFKLGNELINQYEKDFNEARQIIGKLELNKNNLKNYINNLENIKNEIIYLDNKIKGFGNIENISVINFNDEINSINEEIKRIENEKNVILKKQHEFEFVKKQFDDIKNNINNLVVCPVCKQKVPEDHKHGIIEKEETKIERSKNELKELLEKKQELDKNLEYFKNKLVEINEKRIKQNLALERIKEFEELKLKRENLMNKEIDYNNRIKELQKQINDNEKIVINFNDIENKYKESLQQIEVIKNELKKVEIKLTEINTEIKFKEKEISEVQREITRKNEFKLKANNLKEIKFFLESDFSNAIIEIERKVMGKILNDFNELFKNWFNLLVDNDSLQVTLNNTFTPLIEQNGYNVDYVNLSGGEKTAVALAYRLALNQVINNLAKTIKTSDLIVLDEPTDGFSSEQLDRMRLVLNQLNIKQIIIVSHESKIESFVDNVVKLYKSGNTTYLG